MIRIIISFLIITLSCALSAMALEKTGPPLIKLDGGSRGIVKFPHDQHQDTLKDCKVCHTLFPKELGGIKRLKEEGKLAKKQVMNKHCINCHKATKKRGEDTGPTTCSRCHAKAKK